jgi:hypothetical protein
MQIYMHLYMPMLMSAAIATAGYALMWLMGGGGIDLGPPNAKL